MMIRDTALRIRLSGIAILGLFIALAAAAYFSGRQVQRSSELITTDAVPGMIAAHDMRMAMSRSVGYMMVAASAQTTQSRDASIKIAHDADAAFTNAVTQYKTTIKINPSADWAILNQVITRFTEFQRERIAYEALILAGNRNGSAVFLEKNLVPAYVLAIQPAEALLQYNNGDSLTYANYIRNSVHRLYWTVLVVMVLALVCATVLVVSFAIRRREVVELRESEARFRMLIENAPTAISISRVGKTIYVNKKWFALYRKDNSEDVVGQSISSSLAPEFRQMILDRAQRRARGEPMPLEYEVVGLRSDGSRFPLQVAVAQVELSDGPASLAFLSDLTERKRLEQKQVELAAIVASSDDAIIGKSLTGIITSWNRGAEKIFGYAAAEAIGQPLLMLMPADRQHEESKILEMIGRGEAVEHYETVRVRKDGRQIHISATISPLKDGEGKVIGASKIARDITEQKRAEVELISKTALLEAQLDSTIDGILVVDERGKRILQNQRFLELLKVPEEIARDDDDTRMLQHAVNQMKNPAQFKERVDYLYAHPEEVGHEEIELADGRFFDRYSAPVRDKAGKLFGRIWTFRDITEQKRVQEEIRATNERYSRQEAALIDLTRAYAMRRSSVPELKRKVTEIAAQTLEVERISIWCYESDHQTIVCKELFERGAQSHSSGMVFRANDYPSYFRALAEGNIIAAHDAYLDPRTTEFSETYLRPHGISSMMDAPIHVIGNVAGVVCCEHVGPARQWTADEQTFAIAIANVVSLQLAEEERQRIEEQFRQSQKMEAVGQLASGVAHDFNNILAVIQIQAELLKSDGGLTPKQRGFASEIGESTQRAAALTRQLLLFSRKERMQPRELDLDKSINDMTRMLRRILGEHVELQFKFSMQPLFVHADAGMMDQVLMNLAVNARDAMPKGGNLVIETTAVELDELSVKTTPQSRIGAYACLSVSDTGTGIPKDILTRIFEPFFTTKEVGKGTGLGLATVFGIVQQHQGWINVYSEVGRGTTFRIYLPRLAKASDQKVITPMATSATGGSETILVVEDEPALRASVQNILSHLGYRVLEAADGDDALAIWQDHRNEISLLLTDMVMPGGMTGKDLGERLTREKPGLKVIYVSGYSAEVAGKDFPLRDGVNFLTKPFQAQKLAQTIRHNLNS